MTPSERALLLELETLVADLKKTMAPPEFCSHCGRPIRPPPKTVAERVRAHRARKARAERASRPPDRPDPEERPIVMTARAVDQIAESLTDAIAIARGEKKAPRVFVPPEPEA
jgi:hypothetical protein